MRAFTSYIPAPWRPDNLLRGRLLRSIGTVPAALIRVRSAFMTAQPMVLTNELCRQRPLRGMPPNRYLLPATHASSVAARRSANSLKL
jgi:hypothetical protein